MDYEKMFKNYFISSFWLNLLEFIVGYVNIIFLYKDTIRGPDIAVS